MVVSGVEVKVVWVRVVWVRVMVEVFTGSVLKAGLGFGECD